MDDRFITINIVVIQPKLNVKFAPVCFLLNFLQNFVSSVFAI